MRHALALLSLLALAGCAGAAPAATRARTRLHVYAITDTAGYRHASIPDGVAALRAAARVDGRYDVTVLSRASELTGARLDHAAAVVFMLTSGELRVDAAWKRRLLAFVRAGHGLVGFHSASDTFHAWPAWRAMLGGEFARHPYHRVMRVIVEDRMHAATRTLPGAFRIFEEFYFFTSDPRRRAHVLARLDVARQDRPVVWCRHERRGRVFYDALGHEPGTWRDRRQRRLLAGGVAWALALPGGRSACG